jgi:hypothetical protein
VPALTVTLSRRVSRDRREPPSGDDLCQESSVGVAGHDRLLVELADDFVDLVSDVADAFACEDAGWAFASSTVSTVVGQPGLNAL